jgi:CRISPR-associated protein Cmr6
MSNIPLPSDTAHVVKMSGGGDNPYLILRKYTQEWNFDSPKPFEKDRNRDPKEINLKRVKKCFESINADNLAPVANRQKIALEALRQKGYEVFTVELTLRSRLLIGIGEPTVFEVGLLLHPLYGYPYIPGSSLKGITRSWASQYSEIDHKTSLEVFGSESKDPRHKGEENQKGWVTFLDAWPVDIPKLELDVMTPHYGSYYLGTGPAGDWIKPVPIPFLVVKPGTKFRFSIAAPEKKDIKASFTSVKQWFIEALKNGVGAKTSLGYGSFSNVEDTEELSGSFVYELNRTTEHQEERSDWAIQKEEEHQRIQESIQRELQQNPAEKLDNLLDTLSEDSLHDDFYVEWNALEDESSKIALAKKATEKFASYIRKKSKKGLKGYLAELVIWSNK